MITKKITEADKALVDFTRRCDIMGYNNNNSLKAMKFDWCIETGGAWFATYDDEDDIISLSGIHPFKDGYRGLFRGAQLYPRNAGMNRYHMQSHCFYCQMPFQLEFAGEAPVYVTTNIYNDASGRMSKVDRTFHHLAKYGVVSHVGEEELYNTLQNVWVLNKERYTEVRG